MNHASAIVILALLLFGPLAVTRIEHNIELYCLALGVLATMLGTGFTHELVLEALHEPIAISIAVIVAALLFGWTRPWLDLAFRRLRRRVSRPVLTAASVFVIASISSVITAIVGALVLVEVIGLLHFTGDKRVRVTVAGCFAIGMGASLTPLGEPLSTLAARALDLHFFGLFQLLAPWVFPGVLASSYCRGRIRTWRILRGAGRGACASSVRHDFRSSRQGLRIHSGAGADQPFVRPNR